MDRKMSASGPLQWDTSLPDPVQRIQSYIDTYTKSTNYQGFEALLMRTIKIISARTTNVSEDSMEAEAIFEIEAVDGLCNPMGNMHGGAVATLADMATTMATAPIAKKDWWEFGGVSRTLSVTYLKPITKGMTVRVECMLRSIGKRLTVTQCIIKDKKSGTLMALAQHDKNALAAQEGGRKKISQL